MNLPTQYQLTARQADVLRVAYLRTGIGQRVYVDSIARGLSRPPANPDTDLRQQSPKLMLQVWRRWTRRNRKTVAPVLRVLLRRGCLQTLADPPSFALTEHGRDLLRLHDALRGYQVRVADGPRHGAWESRYCVTDPLVPLRET